MIDGIDWELVADEYDRLERAFGSEWKNPVELEQAGQMDIYDVLNEDRTWNR